MWLDVHDEPIPTYGNNGKVFTLYLRFQCQNYYGYNAPFVSEVVNAVWDSVCESFCEVDSGKEIYSGDIAEWFKEEK